jgi:hypothetical protein
MLAKYNALTRIVVLWCPKDSTLKGSTSSAVLRARLQEDDFDIVVQRLAVPFVALFYASVEHARNQSIWTAGLTGIQTSL